FLDTAPASLADAAILHEELNQNHYENNEKDYEQEETDEDRILREHPLQDEFAEDIPFPENAVHPNEDPTSLQNFEEELANAFAKTVLEDSNKIDPHLDAALSLSVHSTPPPPVATLPTFTTMQSYLSAISTPPSSPDVFMNGASSYMYMVSLPERVLRLDDLLKPVPWIPPAPSGPPTPKSELAKYARIGQISESYQLDFWQHYTFETYARHLLLAYLTDANEIEPTVSPQWNLKPQLIGYLGGEAGTGKSAVIAALLHFSRLWGHPNTIETMAFMGLAGLMIDGDWVAYGGTPGPF
ncbi:hypothetical protein HDU78_000312, partial [Chytriomyces hyalinus]